MQNHTVTGHYILTPLPPCHFARLDRKRHNTTLLMKKILLLTSLAICAAPLRGQNAANRENLGDVPATSPPSISDKPPGASGTEAAEVPSEKSADEQFIVKAAKSGMMAVKAGELGTARAFREDLKAFAAKLVKDHFAANAELREIAKTIGMEIPDASHEPSGSSRSAGDPSGRQHPDSGSKNSTREGHSDAHEALKEKTGAEFDTAFIEVMQKGHQEAIAMFEKSQGTVKSPALKAFIVKTLPVLKSHSTALASLERKDPNLPEVK